MSGLPSTSAEAKASGAKFYFTGRACVRGHVADRYVSGSCTACKAEDRKTDVEAKAAYVAAWREANPDKVAKYRAKQALKYHDYYVRTREKQIAKSRKWARENAERVNATNAAWRAANPDRLKVYQQRAKESGKPLERARRYRAEKPEHFAAKSKRWRQSNPDKVRVLDANKKQRRRGVEGTVTKAEIDAILKAQRHRCAWCATSIRRHRHMDHIQPIARGGKNVASNIQGLCPPCNQRKHAADPLDFARREGRLL